MTRANLFAMQCAVALIGIAFWQVASTTTLIGDPH